MKSLVGFLFFVSGFVSAGDLVDEQPVILDAEKFELHCGNEGLVKANTLKIDNKNFLLLNLEGEKTLFRIRQEARFNPVNKHNGIVRRGIEFWAYSCVAGFNYETEQLANVGNCKEDGPLYNLNVLVTDGKLKYRTAMYKSSIIRNESAPWKKVSGSRVYQPAHFLFEIVSEEMNLEGSCALRTYHGE
ncbi:MAG: hypothetical protein AB8E15_10235 [Bdellovibrionales bacterium]